MQTSKGSLWTGGSMSIVFEFSAAVFNEGPISGVIARVAVVVGVCYAWQWRLNYQAQWFECDNGDWGYYLASQLQETLGWLKCLGKLLPACL